jgi:hypothetical protein
VGYEEKEIKVDISDIRRLCDAVEYGEATAPPDCDAMLARERQRYETIIRQLKSQVARYDADMKEAAGELLIPIPEPGTDAAKLLAANRLLRGERDRARAEMNRQVMNVAALRAVGMKLLEAEGDANADQVFEATRMARKVLRGEGIQLPATRGSTPPPPAEYANEGGPCPTLTPNVDELRARYRFRRNPSAKLSLGDLADLVVGFASGTLSEGAMVEITGMDRLSIRGLIQDAVDRSETLWESWRNSEEERFRATRGSSPSATSDGGSSSSTPGGS